MKYSRFLFLSLLFKSTVTLSQNVGIGTNAPQQKLHVAGNVRVDGLAGNNGVLKVNPGGDLQVLANSGNSSEALLGNGLWGTVNGTVPTGGIVASREYVNQELIDKGYILFGALPGSTMYQTSNINAAANTWAPTYVEGVPAKYSPPNFDRNDLYFWVDSVMYVFANNQMYIYNPINDSWRLGFNNPSAFTASSGCQMVRTASEIIVWGGSYSSSTNNGFRYNPGTNTWTAIPTTGQPSARTQFGMQIVNNRLIVWGGLSTGNTLLNDGAVLNLTTNTWSSISATNAPSARFKFTNVANTVQNNMIVWGGRNSTGIATALGDGAMYNPVTNIWSPITSTNAPLGRHSNAAVWTGTEMIIHGGSGGTTMTTYLNDGAKYNPSTNNWTAISTTGSPRLEDHSSIWLGTQMLISGGSDNIFSAPGSPYSNDAYLYDPIANTWQSAGTMGISTSSHKLIMGSNMVLSFGGGISILNPGSSTYTFYVGTPSGSRFFLTPTSTSKTQIFSLQRLYLYIKQ